MTAMAPSVMARPLIEAAWKALLHPLLKAPLRRDVLAVVSERPGLVPVQIVDALAVGNAHRLSYNLVWNATRELARGRLIVLRSGTALAPNAYVTQLGRHHLWFAQRVAR